MKKFCWLALILFFVLPNVVASNISVEKLDKGAVVISELNNPAVFDFIIKNNGPEENYEIYSLVGMSMSPKGMFKLKSGTNRIEVKAYLSEALRKNEGLFNFEYQLRGQESGIFKDSLVIRLVSLKDSFEVEGESVTFGDRNAIVKIRNTQNTNLEDVVFSFESVFFELEEKISLEPFEEKEITIKIDNNSLVGLVAGHYVLKAGIEVDSVKTDIEGTINYLEKESVLVSEGSSGIIIKEKYIKKQNEGNVPVSIEIVMKRDIFTRLFTVYSEDPDSSERKGLMVYYTWNKNIMPKENFEIISTTNYTFPFLVVFLVVIIILLIEIYSLTALRVNKKVSFVKTKEGEFALKVRIGVKARKDVNNVNIVDFLPGSMKLFEGYGKRPDKVDEKTRRIFWKLGRMNAGEERVLSYIIYSKLRAFGKFELPPARVVYEFNGRVQDSFSNRTFFMSEESIGEED